jgi:hypothetical protein
MKAFCLPLVLVLSAIPVEPSRIITQSDKKVPTSVSFEGSWEGEMNDLPAIDLKIKEAHGTISGVIIFYFQVRSDANAPWHVKSENAELLLSPHVDRNTLTFEVQHHKCHTCAELGPNVKFRMEITGSDEARLWKLENEEQEKNKGWGPGLKLIRRTEVLH